MLSYDLVIIGAGWAGINVALSAKKHGLKVALVEKDFLGGTCLNYGCIPTKHLIQYAKLYLKTKNTFPNFNPLIDFKELQNKKDSLVQKLRLALENRIKGISYFQGIATLVSPQEVKVEKEILKTKYIVIATGSYPKQLDCLKFDKKRVLSSTELLELKKVPSSILIVGAGVIGCEFASLFNILGSQVTLVEFFPQILPQEDSEISSYLSRIFKKRGIKIYTSTDIRNMDTSSYEIILVATGRAPFIDGINLENLGVKIDKDKRIIADKYLRTNISNIFCAGDVTNQFMLAHLAAYQGRLLAENLINQKSPQQILTECIAVCIFTYPEVARVGLTEEQARQHGNIKINKFDFLGLGTSHILGETEGLIKIISDMETGLILGASMVGPLASEIIGILTLAIKNKLTIKELSSTIFAHPTLSEAISQAVNL